MIYSRLNDLIEIDPQGMDVGGVLLAIAMHSYETAPLIKNASSTSRARSTHADLERRIEYRGGQPVRLILDIVDGRRCRTWVERKYDDGKLYLNIHGFLLRGDKSPEDFLQEVKEILDGAGKPAEHQKSL